MPFREQPMEAAYQPKRYEAPDFEKEGLAQALVLGGKVVMYLVWQDPDRVMVISKVSRGEKHDGIVSGFESELRRMAEANIKPKNAYVGLLRMIPNQLPAMMKLKPLLT